LSKGLTLFHKPHLLTEESPRHYYYPSSTQTNSWYQTQERITSFIKLHYIQV